MERGFASVDEVDFDLYPDIQAAGGLIAALELTAAKNGFDLGELYSHYTSGPGRYTTAESNSSRGRISVQLDGQSRTFYLAIQGDGFTWAEGATDDLGGLAEALAEWHAGVSVDEFAAKFHFVSPGRLARVHEASDPTLAQWHWLRTAEEFSTERPIVEAAYADNRLSTLFPNLSHGVLRLSWDRGRQGARELRIIPLAGDSYRVEDTASPDAKIVLSLVEALATAAGFFTDI
jgi:hypothetical protein